MQKKIFGLLFALSFVSFVNGTWYDAPLRWFNQGIDWFRQSSYNTYQKALVLAGYRAYQQPSIPPTSVIDSHKKAILTLEQQLSTDIDAAILAVQLLTDLEQEWEKEIQQKHPKYPELLHQEQMGRYSAWKQAMLEKYPKLNALSKYDQLISTIDDPTKDPLSYFPSISSALNNIPAYERSLETLVRNIIVWITRTQEYFKDPFASKYSLSTLQQELQKAASRFALSMKAISISLP